MKKTAIVIFENQHTHECIDLEVPLHITANELIFAVNQGLQLGIDMEDVSQCYLSSVNPIALIRGEKQLQDFNIHHGTRIIYTR